MTQPYRFIGKATPRKDGVEIVTGEAKFIADIKLPKMLFGKVLRSPLPHANIRNIDTSKAKRLDSVKAVLTYQDVPEWKGGMPAHVCILDRKVRFVGDAVALVAAETEDIALEALDRIDVEYEPLPPVYDMEEATGPDAPQLYTQFPGNVLPNRCPVFGPKSLEEIAMGNVEQGFKEADIVAEGTYAYENIPNPLTAEPPGAIAAWEGPDHLTVWSSTQNPYWEGVLLYLRMGRKVHVRYIGTHCGGSYGTRGMSWQLIFYAALLAKATNRPVKVCYSREEHFAAYGLRLGSRIHGKVGMKKEGTITAISGEWLINTGFYSHITQGQLAVGCGEVQLAVRCPNWNLKPKIVCTNRAASGIVRGFGGQELKSAFLPLLTEAMEKADLDPMEFFKKNYVKPGDGYYWRDGNWWVCRGVDYTKAMEKGAQVFGWKEKWKGWLKPTWVNGTKRIGVGVGVHGNADVGEDVSEAYVRVDPNATATIYSCLSEHGTGQRSSLCKMVAEILQLPLENISMTPPDSLLHPYEIGPFGSRGTYAIGSAIIAAAEEAKKKLFERCAPMLKANPEDLETEDGWVYRREKPEVRIPWRAGMGVDRTLLGYGRFEPDFTVPNFMMLFVEVEVDLETGKVELGYVVSATDVGQIIDPLNLKNQLHGSLGSAGVDSALFEESILDKKSGRLLNINLVDYKWRTFLELPVFRTVTLETPFLTHRFKAIGVGEITTAPGPPAILMAVSNAIGRRVYEYPITPEKILRALVRRREV
jgi:xanthine dehydrogenase molybdenum-binding subunit